MADLVGPTHVPARQLGEFLDPFAGTPEYSTWEGMKASWRLSGVETIGTQFMRFFEKSPDIETQIAKSVQGDEIAPVVETEAPGFWQQFLIDQGPKGAVTGKTTAQLIEEEKKYNPLMSEKDWTNSNSFRSDLKWHEGMRLREAKSLAKWKDEERNFRKVLEGSPRDFWATLGGFGAGMARQFVDPGNLILAVAVPAVGLGATLGKTVARSGALSLAENVFIEAFVYKGLKEQQYDMDYYHPLLNIAFGTILGTGFGAAGFKLREWSAKWAKKNPGDIEPLNKEAAVETTKHLDSGEPANVGPVLTRHGSEADRSAEVNTREQYNREQYDVDSETGEEFIPSRTDQEQYEDWANNNFEPTQEEISRGVTSLDKKAEAELAQVQYMREGATFKDLDSDIEVSKRTGDMSQEQVIDYNETKALGEIEYESVIGVLNEWKVRC